MALNLNYTPNKLVDITTLTEDQWLDWRRKGIGGSCWKNFFSSLNLYFVNA